MAKTTGSGAIGTLLKRGDGNTPEYFGTVLEVVSIGGPGLSTDTIDMTHMESPDSTKEFLPSLKEAGELTFEINFQPGSVSHKALLSDWANRSERNWKLVWPDKNQTTWPFVGFVTGFEPGGAVGDKLSASVTIKITGSPTLPA